MKKLLLTALLTGSLLLSGGVVTATAEPAAPAAQSASANQAATQSVPAQAAAASASARKGNPNHKNRGRDARRPGKGGSQTAVPLIHAHRGASGYRPEHTLAAYRLAVQQGADYIEPDLVMTKDGVLVVRHEPEISGTTDVAAHPEFADRQATKQLDGQPVTGWFTEDFTLAELKTLRAVERLPQLRQQNTIFDGRYEVPTFEEVLQLREQLSQEAGREIGVIPEIKHSTYTHTLGLNPEAELLRLVNQYRLNNRRAPLWVQSFELGNLLQLRQDGYRANLVFLTTRTGAPYDLVAKGDPRTYADLLRPRSLRELSRTINGIGPEKRQVIAWNDDNTLGAPTTLVRDAHAAGLSVTTWTFRAENQFLPADYRSSADPAAYGRVLDEVRAHLDAGVDGIFCDQPDLCSVVREEWLADR